MDTQEQPNVTARSLKELLDKLAWQREAEALYEAFTEALESIPDRGIKAEVCMNTVRYIATQNATARVTDETNDEEVASLFEEECKRFAVDLMEMPGQFREWLKKHPDHGLPRATSGIKNGGIINLLVKVLGGPVCECERCTAFRASVGEPDRAETPTEVPPPPDPIN